MEARRPESRCWQSWFLPEGSGKYFLLCFSPSFWWFLAILGIPWLLSESVCRSIMSDSLQPHGQLPARLLCSWDSPSKNTGVSCHALLQGIFPTQGSNFAFCKEANSLTLSHQGSPDLYSDTLRPHSRFRNFLPFPEFYSVPCQFPFPPLVPSKHWSLHFIDILYKLKSTLYNILCLNSFTLYVL